MHKQNDKLSTVKVTKTKQQLKCVSGEYVSLRCGRYKGTFETIALWRRKRHLTKPDTFVFSMHQAKCRNTPHSAGHWGHVLWTPPMYTKKVLTMRDSRLYMTICLHMGDEISSVSTIQQKQQSAVSPYGCLLSESCRWPRSPHLSGLTERHTMVTIWTESFWEDILHHLWWCFCFHCADWELTVILFPLSLQNYMLAFYPARQLLLKCCPTLGILGRNTYLYLRLTMWDCWLCNVNDSHKPTATLKLDFITASVYNQFWYQMTQWIKWINLH